MKAVKIVVLIFVLLAAAPIFAAEKSDVSVKNFPEQSLSDDNQTLMNNLASSVTSWCEIRSGGQSIVITAQNTGMTNAYCTITCPYKTKNGYSGAHQATGTVAARTGKHDWSPYTVSGEKFTKNGTGTQSCN